MNLKAIFETLKKVYLKMKFLVALSFFLCYVQGFSQMMAWQGFEMNWTYNHRLNRLGSFVYNDSVFNTAATGTGIDSGWFKTNYFLIPEINAKYNEFCIKTSIKGNENKFIQVEIDTVVPVSFHHSIFYLNGFDMIAKKDADKLQLLHFGVKMIKGNNDSSYIKINISLIVNCKSIECNWCNKEVDYDFNVYIGHITFTNDEYIKYVKYDMYNSTSIWTRKSLYKPSIILPSYNNLPRFITDMEIALNKEHWYSGLQASIDSANNVCMHFEQYKNNMQKNAYYKPHAFFSKKEKGNAFFNMRGIVLTTPQIINEKYGVFSGFIIWKGNNKSAFSKDAVKFKSIN